MLYLTNEENSDLFNVQYIHGDLDESRIIYYRKSNIYIYNANLFIYYSSK